MAEPPAVRASDADRERVALELRDHTAAGRLTLEELSERLDRAYAAKTLDELAAVTTDLPAESGGATAVRRRKPSRFSVAIFGGADRRGRWRIAHRFFALTLFGGADLDLRHAQIDDAEVTLTLLTLFGGGDVYVPEGIECEVGGFAIFGGNDEHGRDLPPRPGTPLVRVRAITMFGGTDVWRVPAGEDGPLRELRRKVR